VREAPVFPAAARQCGYSELESFRQSKLARKNFK
jgi:hypothetical protein